MRDELRRELARKGWAQKEIEHAIHIMHRADAKKSRAIKFIEHSSYFVALMLLIWGNFLISLVLVPALLTLEGIYLYGIIAITAASFGLFLEHILDSMDNLAPKRHISAVIIIPSLAVMNFLVITQFANSISLTLTIQHTHNPAIVGLVYGASFMLPYLTEGFGHRKLIKA